MMLSNHPSSMAICPINFKSFNTLQAITGDFEETLVLAKIKFHSLNSKFTDAGKKWIARTIKNVGDWFGFSSKKAARILEALKEKNLICKDVSTWYGRKRIFISASDQVANVPVNIVMLNRLIQAVGSLNGALIFSKIAYAHANSHISHENKRWCCLSKESLCQWANLSPRSMDGILEKLIQKGFILKKKLSWKGRIMTHFHIPDLVIDQLKKNQKEGDNLKKNSDINSLSTSSIKPNILKKEKTKDNTNRLSTNSSDAKIVNGQNCRSRPAKMSVFTKIRTNKENNNTAAPKKPTPQSESDITFEKISERLTPRQESYLKAALNRTIERKKLSLSSPHELWEELKFWMVNPDQHKGIHDFKYAVSRAMKILGDRNWRTPIGFHNHSEMGKAFKKEKDERDKKPVQRDDYQPSRSTPKIGMSLGEVLAASTHKIQANEFTEKGIEAAKQLAWMVKEVKKNPSGAEKFGEMITGLIKKIGLFFKQGADKDQITPHLPDL